MKYVGFQIDVNVPAITVFLQGILSFFSPCVLPLIPLYIGYLSGGTGKRGEDGKMYYDQKKVMVHTFCFVIGVSFAFFLLGLGVSTLGSFFTKNQTLFSRGGGILVILIGLYQLGLFGTSEVLSRERRLLFSINVLAMSPLTAILLGFTFSFAWTPCVGPTLASVLLMAASAATKAKGFFLIGVYTLGFVLPFLTVGLFTTTVLDFFKKHGNVVAYTVKAGAVLMILIGIMMFTGVMNTVTGYMSDVSLPKTSAPETSAAVEQETIVSTTEEATETEETTEEAKKVNTIPAIDFTLLDQYGNTHTLSEYKGKTVFLNFWATWCPPCRKEMPDIQKLYEEYLAEEDPSVIILGIAAPNYGREGREEEIIAFLEKNGYTYPVVMDTTGEMFMQYGIYSFPTTFMIDAEGNIFGYASGQLNEMVMRSIIEQTVTGVRYGTDTQS